MLKLIVNKAWFFYFILLVALFNFDAAIAQKSKDDLYRQREKLQEEISFTAKLLEKTSEKKGLRENQVRLLSRKIKTRENLVRNYENEIAIVEQKIDDRRLYISKLEAELKKHKKLYADFIIYSYKNHNHFSIAVYLLASNNINQFYLRKKYLEQLKEARVKKILLINKISETIELEIIKLDEDRNKIRVSLEKIKFEQINLSKEKHRKERSVRELSGEESALKKSLNDKRKVEEEIEKRLEALIREEAKKSKYAKLTPEQELIATDFQNNRGRLPWPTRQGIITGTFGEQWHPFIKGVKIQNNGIDITSLNGELVRCVFNGEVSRIFRIKGAEYTVIVKHGSYYTVYHNLNNIIVSVGDKVKTKSTLGYVSKGKEGEDSIIHFEVWKGLNKLNPEEWISN